MGWGGTDVVDHLLLLFGLREGGAAGGAGAAEGPGGKGRCEIHSVSLELWKGIAGMFGRDNGQDEWWSSFKVLQEGETRICWD